MLISRPSYQYQGHLQLAPGAFPIMRRAAIASQKGDAAKTARGRNNLHLQLCPVAKQSLQQTYTMQPAGGRVKAGLVGIRMKEPLRAPLSSSTLAQRRSFCRPGSLESP
jgi:hypothetical protein